MTICGTVVGTTSSASVLATTSATLNPEAVSIKVARPPGNPITAMSVTTRFDGSSRCQRQIALCDDLGLSLGRMLHGGDYAFCAGHQIYGSALRRRRCLRSQPLDFSRGPGWACSKRALAHFVFAFISGSTAAWIRARGCGFHLFVPGRFRFLRNASRLIPTGLERPLLPSTKRIFDGRKHQLFPFHLQPQPEPSAILHFSRQRVTVSSGSR